MKRPFVKLIASFLIVFTAAGIGSYVTYPAISTWYQTLIKPTFNPPNVLFGPVWTALFILMAISLYMVWIEKGKKNRRGLQLFFIQLSLNTLWSVLFFGFKLPLLALVDIIALWIGIFLTIREFKKVSPTASWLLVPYILWVSFAAVLNLSIVLLN